MLNNPTINKLREMKLKVMAQLLAEPDPNLRELSFDERFAIMVEKEWYSKKNAKIKKLIHNASFGINACIEDIDYSSERTINKKTVQMLAAGTYINQKLNVLVTGRTGSGYDKSTIM